MLQRAHPRFQLLDEALQRLVLGSESLDLLLKSCVRRSKLGILGFKFLNPSL
jgi:hypothetical protein